MTTADRSFDLPPRPDPYSGEPRPPRAPAYRGDDEDNKKSRDRDPRRKPDPPEGQGPTLAWYQASRRHAWAAFVVALIVFAVGGVLLSWLRNGDGPPFQALVHWQLWLVLLVFAVPMGMAVRIDRCSAGAEWLRRRRKWVRLYELTSVKVKYYGDGKPELEFDDRAGRHLEVEWALLCNDRLLWDLVYNGVLHSTTCGASVDKATQNALRLPGATSR